MFQRIVVTGDLHGNINKLAAIVKSNGIGKGDLVLVAGDFGFVMRNSYGEETTLDDISRSDFTLAFVAGNHEHYPRLCEYPDGSWCDGRVKVLRDNVLMLENGEMYKLPLVTDDSVTYKTLFTMGGARSTDIGINKNRYPTLWLRCDLDTGRVSTYRADDSDSESLKKGFTAVTDRDTCYKLVNKIYADFYGECDGGIDIDRARDCQSKAIQHLLYTLCEEQRQKLDGIIKNALLLMGYSGKVRFVLIEGTWFKEELPSSADYKNAGDNLNRAGMKADIILTHTLPHSIVKTLSQKLGFYVDTDDRQSMELTGFLDYVFHDVKFSKWMAGHFHLDNSVSDFLSDIYPDIKNSDSKYNDIHILFDKIKVI